MNLTRPDISSSTQSGGARYETLSGLLEAYRTPVAIILFGVIVSLSLFFATLLGHSRAKEREFRNHAAARIAEIQTGFTAIEAELTELAHAAGAGLAPQTVIGIFGVADGEVATPPVRDLGLVSRDAALHAIDAGTARQVQRAVAYMLERGPAPQTPVLLPLPAAAPGEVPFVPIAPLPAGPYAYAYVTSDFDALMQPTELRSDPAWVISSLYDGSPQFALARNADLRARTTPAMMGVISVLDTAPYALHWSGEAPFDVVDIAIVPRRSYLLQFGPLPWLVLAFCLFATAAIGALALKDARRTAEIRRQVDLKTAELRRSQAVIEAKNEELARFAAHASHDLQAPLRAMKGMSSLLVERQIDLDDRSQQMLQRINRGADRAQRLVQDLLSYTKADMAQVNAETIPPETLRNEIDELLAATVEECGGRLRWQIDAPVEADRFLLTRALQNLISNAIKYRADRPLRIDVSTRTDADGSTICVSDNGMGIEPKHFERIFRVFKRLHGADEIEGSGIGLALCKRVADLHGGRIWVESEPGVGSHFFLHIPSVQAPRAAISNDR